MLQICNASLGGLLQAHQAVAERLLDLLAALRNVAGDVLADLAQQRTLIAKVFALAPHRGAQGDQQPQQQCQQYDQQHQDDGVVMGRDQRSQAFEVLQ